MRRLTPVLHRPAEPSTSNDRPAAARPTAPLRRHHPLQPTPPRQNTPLDVTSPHQTVPSGTPAPGPQRHSQNSTLSLLVGSDIKCSEQNTGGDNRITKYFRKTIHQMHNLHVFHQLSFTCFV
ncbi:unnamed protein product, partial [Schistosoma margrebowiei]